MEIESDRAFSPNILIKKYIVSSRFIYEDLLILSKIAEKENEKIKIFTKVFLNSIIIIPGIILFEEKNDFSYEHLCNLKLIKKVDGLWRLTYTGKKFIEDICTPS